MTNLHPRLTELIDHLALHRRHLGAAVDAVPSEHRETKPAPDRWSVAEVLEHISKIERGIAAMIAKQVEAARAGGVGPDAETNSVVASYVDPDRVTDRTRKIAAPERVQPTGTLDASAGTEALESSRAAMMAALHNANGVSLTGLVVPHPVLGPLNLYHWVVALGLHDLRHSDQIREIGAHLAQR